MKAEIRIIQVERLPGIRMRLNVEAMEGLRRIEEIARENKELEVRSNYEGDGELHCNVVSLADRNEPEHKGLFAMFVHWKKDGRDLQLQVAASWWNPDPPKYSTYVSAAKRLFLPVIREYNNRYKTRHRMRIETPEQLEPKMTPAVEKAFKHFVHTANKEALHPLDWEAFYHFVHTCHRSRKYFYEDDIRWFCRRAGFNEHKAKSLQLAFSHCYDFLDWYQRGHR
jgi:hypothetical protein